MVGAVRFELTTSCTRSKRASQTTLRPDTGELKLPADGQKCNAEFAARGLKCSLDRHFAFVHSQGELTCRQIHPRQNKPHCRCQNGGPVAQWLEQSTHNALVPGSSPGRPTNPGTIQLPGGFTAETIGLAGIEKVATGSGCAGSKSLKSSTMNFASGNLSCLMPSTTHCASS
jgi:hypothetical protein